MSSETHRAFGVEQEHFLFDRGDLAPTHEKIDCLWDNLVNDGFRIRAATPSGVVLSVEKNTEYGPLVVTNDACTHIIETAFPKMTCLSSFRELYESTWSTLQDHFETLGLKIRLGGVLNEEPERIHWRPGEKDPTGIRLRRFLDRDQISHSLFCSNIPACVAATQVSLEIPEDEAILKLPYFYSSEYLIPLNFSNSHKFQGETAHCVRPLMLFANFHQPYPLLGVPSKIPKSLEEYETMRLQCSGRDYSFVSIRDAFRVEFRSACSQNTVDDVLRLVRFRLDVDRGFTVESNAESHIAVSRFRQVCESGQF
ncbi:MAG: hypothetical protein ACK5OC_24710 [Pirellula sp.]